MIAEMDKENYHKRDASVFIAAVKAEMMVTACQSQYCIFESHALIQTLI